MFGKNRLRHSTQERGECERQNEPDGMVIDLLYRKSLLIDGENIPRGAWDIGVIDEFIKGKDHVIGAEGLAVVPTHVLTQMERPGQTIFADVPGLCQVGFDLCGKSVGCG